MSQTSAPKATEPRRKSLVGALLVAVCMAAAVVVPSTAQAADQPILFGATPPRNGNAVQSLQRFENQLGQKLGLVRVFLRWDEAGEGKPYHDEILGGGRTMHLSVRAKASNGPLMSWNSIANAQPGSKIYNEIVGWADYIKTLNGDVWFTFNQEPEIRVNDAQGSPASFRAAYRKVHQVFEQRGATNVKHAWVMSNYAFELQVKKPNDRRAALQWYPGDDVVDLIGADPYDWSNCRTNNAVINRPMSNLLQYFLTFSNAHPNQDLILGEWAASGNRNFGTQAGFIEGTRQLFKQSEWSKMVGVSYFGANDPSFPNCPWDPRGNTGSMQALQNMQRDPAYAGAGGGGNPAPAPAPAPNPQPEPEPAPQPVQVTNTFVGKAGQGVGVWKSHKFTPSVSGTYTVKVAWAGSAKLKSDVRIASSNQWLGSNTSASNNPFTYTVKLNKGQRVSLAVWTASGVSDYFMEVSR